MKVLLINGSPHKKGTTFTCLDEIAKTFNQEGIEAEIYNIPQVAPCKGCNACFKLGHCVTNDEVADFVEKIADYDGFVIASPVHYAAASGLATTFLDRVFFVDFASGKNNFRHKPGAAVAVARRSGTTATLDQLNKYFTISQMPVISGRYWNMVHGHNGEEAMQDLEGIQNLRMVAKNMAYFLKCKESGSKAGINPPEMEEVVHTNFIR